MYAILNQFLKLHQRFRCVKNISVISFIFPIAKTTFSILMGCSWINFIDMRLLYKKIFLNRFSFLLQFVPGNYIWIWERSVMVTCCFSTKSMKFWIKPNSLIHCNQLFWIRGKMARFLVCNFVFVHFTT